MGKPSCLVVGIRVWVKGSLDWLETQAGSGRFTPVGFGGARLDTAFFGLSFKLANGELKQGKGIIGKGFQQQQEGFLLQPIAGAEYTLQPKR